ncbi:MAG: hypothetical protein FJY97_10320 [candidate division Zixibacteria bacterium]|nr:hypothetical protein [candidate division Zixibacteria bacterium]
MTVTFFPIMRSSHPPGHATALPPYGIVALIVFLAVSYCTNVALSAQRDTTYTLFQRTAELTLVPGVVVYPLPDAFVVSGSETLSTHDVTLTPQTDYTIDYTEGRVLLNRAPAETTLVTIRYRRIPVALSRQFYRRKQVHRFALPESVRTVSVRERMLPAYGSGSEERSTLRVGGSKTIGIVTGSHRDASFQQSLRVEITGRPARDVEVVALLSDRSNPIQPDGVTRQLSELDRILVEVRTPSVTTTMGDQTLSLRQSQFARYERRMKGLRGEVRGSSMTLEAVAGVSEGRYTTYAFQGVEGVQGPYPLRDENGGAGFLLIVGTEKVWVDGVRMTRGEDEDYTIDYATAEITFTRNRPITQDSRILADFEASDEQFRKNVYLTRGTLRSGETATFGATYIREGLEALPTSASPATPSASSFPASESVAGIDWRAEWSPGWRMEGELAHNRRGRQTTGGASGNAVFFSTRYAPNPTGMLRPELHALIRSVDAGFRPIDRVDDPEFYRRYDQGASGASAGRMIEAGGVQGIGRATFKMGVGRFSRPDGFSSLRYEAGAEAVPMTGLTLSYFGERIRSHPGAGSAATETRTSSAEGRWLRQRAHAAFEQGWLRPRVSFNRENRVAWTPDGLRSQTGFSEWQAAIDATHGTHLMGRTEFTQRISETMASSESSPHTARHTVRTLFQRVALRDWRAVSAALQLTERFRSGDRFSRVSARDRLVDGRVAYTPMRKSLTVDARYEVSRGRAAHLTREYVFVGEGRGDFRLEPISGEYLPDTDGEYQARYTHAGDFTPTTGVRSGLSFLFQPHRSERAFLRPFRYMTLETYFAGDAWRKSGRGETTLLSPFSQIPADTSTVYGNLSFRQDIGLFPLSRTVSVRLRYQRNQTIDNRLTSGAEHWLGAEYALRVKTTPTHATAVEMDFVRREKRRTDTGQDRYRIYGYQGEMTVSHRPRKTLELSLRLLGGRDRERLAPITTVNVGTAPAIAYYLSGRGRAAAGLEWQTVYIDSRVFVPFEMANGRRPGQNARWYANIDYRVGGNFTLLMRYDGRKERFRPVEHTARAEMRAFF